MLFCWLPGLLLFSLVVEATCVVTLSVSTVSNNNEMAGLFKKKKKNPLSYCREGPDIVHWKCKAIAPGICDSGKDGAHTYIGLTLS